MLITDFKACITRCNKVYKITFDICKRLHFIHHRKRAFWSSVSIVIGSDIPAHTMAVSKKCFVCFDWEHIAGILSKLPVSQELMIRSWGHSATFSVSWLHVQWHAVGRTLAGTSHPCMHPWNYGTCCFQVDLSWFGAGLHLKLIPAESPCDCSIPRTGSDSTCVSVPPFVHGHSLGKFWSCWGWRLQASKSFSFPRTLFSETLSVFISSASTVSTSLGMPLALASCLRPLQLGCHSAIQLFCPWLPYVIPAPWPSGLKQGPSGDCHLCPSSILSSNSCPALPS